MSYQISGSRFVFWFIVLLLFAASTIPVVSQPVINEFLASNRSVLADENGNYPDWIELYNPTQTAISLNGFGISDNPGSPAKWVFPDYLLQPDSYLLLFASGEDRTPPSVFETVINRGDEWRYAPGISVGSSFWPNPGFDDTNWMTGASGIGYGDDDDATVISPAISVFARKVFAVESVSDISELFFHLDYDDGFVAYLNGVEIGRDNLEGIRPSGNLPAVTFTEPLLIRGLPLFQWKTDRPDTLLVTGENVLAVQVHNNSFTSSDLSLIPFLTFGYSNPPSIRRDVAVEVHPRISTSPHTNFKLSAEGESIILTSPTNEILDRIDFGPQRSDISLGRRIDQNTTWEFFPTPTPGKSNTGPSYSDFAPKITISPAGGRFTTAVRVSASAKENAAVIRYTLDGSTPSESDPVFPVELVFNQTGILRARAFLPGALGGEIAAETYLINEPSTLPVFSIMTDPDNLWSSETGIYVAGPNAEPGFPYFGANFWQDWERPIQFSLFESDGASMYRGNAGIKIFGQWSRGHPQKSLSVFARSGYGTQAFDWPLFPSTGIQSYQAFVLRNSGNDWNTTHFRDALMHKIVEQTNLDIVAYRPMAVFVNGEYWGIQNAREKINEHYIASHHGVDPDNIDLLENNLSVIHGSAEHYEDVLNFLSLADIHAPETMAYVENAIDVNNFITYQIAQIFFDNRDWPGNNTKFWRPREAGGKWKWILFDTDFGFGIWDPNAYTFNTFEFATATYGPDWPNPPWSTYLLRTLLKNAEFKQRFFNQFAFHLNSTFLPTTVFSHIDEYKAGINSEMDRHLSRWGGDRTTWENNVARLKSFALGRPSNVWSHLSKYLGEPGTVRFTVSRNLEGAGDVLVSDLKVPEPTWTASFFRNSGINLRAVPEPGFRFTHWSGSVTSASPEISVLPNQDDIYVAHFEPAILIEGDIVVTEIQYNAGSAWDAEDWVEVFNAGSTAVNLSSWQIRDDDDTHVYEIPAGIQLLPGQYWVFCRNLAAFSQIYPGVTTVSGDLGFGLSSSGDDVRLFDHTGTLIDRVSYLGDAPWPAMANGTDFTLELTSTDTDNGLPASWHASSVPGGTPGMANSTPTAGNSNEIPVVSSFDPPYPNPANRLVNLRFTSDLPSLARIEIFDVLGRRVAIPFDQQVPGNTTFIAEWDTGSFPVGIYIARLILDDVPFKTQKIMISGNR